MHELSIANDIFNGVVEETKKRKISRIISIKIEVGKLMAIVPEALEFSFETITKGTFLEGAKLDIVDVPLKMKCNNCSNEFEVNDYAYTCPNCQNTECEIISGNELLIKSLETE